MQTPASRYEPSLRQMPHKLPPLAYPDRFEVRYVSANGGIRWNRPWGNVAITCAGEDIGLEGIDDGVWNVYFGPLKLGRLLERHMRIEDAYGRLTRHSKQSGRSRERSGPNDSRISRARFVARRLQAVVRRRLVTNQINFESAGNRLCILP